MEIIDKKYKIQSMQEINDLAWNGYNAVSTFSGCGGSSLGYKMANFKVLWANEFIDAARECYKANHKTTILDGRDIRKVSGSDILNAVSLNVGEIDLFDGSPPCASFSTAGNREDDWGKVKKYSDKSQRTDDLFYEYARLIKETQPKVFVAENVKGITMGVATSMLGSFQDDMFDDQSSTIIRTLMACGYKVDFRVLNSVNYGVPQARQRTIFIGVRNDLGLLPKFPLQQNTYFTTNDSFADLINSEEEIKESQYKPTSKIYGMIKKLKEGESGDTLPESNGSYFGLQRIRGDRPCPTICQRQGNKGAGLVHPKEDRELTVSELKRLSSFPDDFILTGNYKRKCERIGRAVPPLLMKAIAKEIQESILMQIKK
jgi:DNA (cytosine-5)-methyltransferase 1